MSILNSNWAFHDDTHFLEMFSFSFHNVMMLDGGPHPEAFTTYLE